jgi:hypothetical protein
MHFASDKAQSSRRRPPSGNIVERRPGLTGKDLAEIVELLERKLAWFGLRSVKVGPFVRVKDDMVSIDLIDRCGLSHRIELEGRSRRIEPSSGDALLLLMTPLRCRNRN